MRALLTCLALLLAPVSAAAQDTPRVTVQGTGEVSVVPDMATISVSVVREAVEATEATAALSEATAAVLARLEAEGIAATDVQTGQLSLQPRFDRSEDRTQPRITGYVARTSLTVRVRDLDALGSLLDLVVADGANGLDGLRFGLSEPDAVEAEARRAAFADAMEKAGTYADAAGMTLGPIVSLAEGGAPFGVARMEMAVADVGTGVPVAPGEVTQMISVTLVVELAPAE